MNTHEWRETTAQLADASACGACRALRTFGDAIRAMALPDMGDAEAMREACAMAVARWAGKDWSALVRLIRALPLPAATPDKTAEALEMARRAIAGTLEETFGSIRLSYPLDRLLREALAAIDAAKGGS